MRIKPKKRLGQNFLIDPNIRRKIVSACDFKSSDIILEIGAGRGEMTGLLMESADKLYAAEIDRGLCVLLREKFKGCQKVRVIEADILKMDLRKYFPSSGKKIKIFGNIPYYITTPIILRLLKFKGHISDAFLMLQKEFALRLTADAGSKDYGAFSCFLQYYCRAEIIFTVRKGSFYPRPKVDSSFIRLKILNKPQVAVKDEDYFFKVIRSSFQQRRKMLKNSLLGIIPEEKLDYFFNKYNINNKVRPEELSLKDFAALSNI